MEYDRKMGRFIRPDGYHPAVCSCRASLEWRHQEWPHPTERCRLCRQDLPPAEFGEICVSGIDEYDYASIAEVAREYATTIPWVRDNIMIVVPEALHAQLREKLESLGNPGEIFHYVSLDDEESRR